MRQQHVDSWWAQWTCVGGSCAPPPSPAASRFERALDMYTNATAPFVRGCFVFVTVAAVAALSSAAGPIGGLMIQGAFFLAFAIYCLANFARCREAHCIVTGIGWSALAVACAVAAVAHRDARSSLWIAFLVIAVVGHGFEAVWKARHGSNAIRLAHE